MRLRCVAFRALSLLALTSSCKREQALETASLWPDGAPGSEARASEPEVARDWWVKNVHDPSLTVVRTRSSRSTGAGVVVMPGGGHEQLVFGPEGLAPARFLAKRGVTAFVLKYRLARAEGSPYSMDHAVADAARAVRWVRHHASRYGVKPERVGVMGWSAGGELAATVSYGDMGGDPGAADPMDRLSARPNFQIAIYPGPAGIPESVPHDAPPAFFLAANDDADAAEAVAHLLRLYRRAERPVELHLFSRGGHAFNMGERAELQAIRHWPDRLTEWLEASGLVGG